eukprot:754452-Hanusia_phi.AAC.20
MIRVLDDMLVNLTLGGGQNETDKLLHRDLQIAIRLAQAEFYAFGENNVSKAEGAYELLLKQVAKNAFRRYPLSNEMIDVFLELLCTHHVEVGGERDPVYDDVAVALEGRVRGGEGSSFMISAFARISSSELAMEKLQESLAMRPNDETLWIVSFVLVMLARAYIEEWKGRQKEAEEFILHALALSPRHGFLLARAGTSALKFRGNPFTCSNFLEQAIRQGYKSPEVLRFVLVMINTCQVVVSANSLHSNELLLAKCFVVFKYVFKNIQIVEVELCLKSVLLCYFHLQMLRRITSS